MGVWRDIKSYFRKKKRIAELDKNHLQFLTKNSGKKGKFLMHETPEVSIIIPYYNQSEYTKNCLNSILQNYPEATFELILVDDKSTENTDFPTLFPGVKIIRNEENLGFLKSVNVAIKQATGKYIYLLNNDTIVHSGFLDELIYVFKNFENVGAVGSMLLNSDGSLQEAGSVFLKDGNISQVFGNKKIYYPEFNFTYPVDYCSGCSLLFKRTDNQGNLQLFDEEFAPAYFEETDLCFKLKNIHKKEVYFTPFSKITHFNGVSYNNNIEFTAKKQELFDKNYEIFKKRWGKILDEVKAENPHERILELHGNKSVIFFVNNIPEFDKSSGDLRLLEIIKSFLAKNYLVTIFCKDNKITNPYNIFYQKLGVCVYYEHSEKKELEKFLNKIANQNSSLLWFYAISPFVNNYKNIKKLLPNSKVIFDMVDIHHLRFERAFQLNNTKSDRKLYEFTKKNELLASEKSDVLIAISEDEKKYMSQFVNPEKTEVISNIHYLKAKIDEIPTFSERKNLLFVGSIHEPNIDAVNFLSEKIMPLVWEQNSEICVDVVGNVKEMLPPSKDSRINYHGYVPKMEDFLKNSKIMIAPLRYGAGVKGKIGQAFEYFLPVITTEIGAEGMKLQNDENALIANSAEDFAGQILRLYHDEILWKKLQKNSEQSLFPFSVENLSRKIEIIEKKLQ